MTDAIATSALTKRFHGGQVAVDSINLSVPQGAVYGFLGPNGSGKTTTIRILLGLVSATEGEHTLLGQPMPQQAATVLPRVGALVEGPAFHPYLSGRDNLLRLDAADRTVVPAKARDRVETAKGDFFTDPLPKADVITMGMILHDWNLEKKKALIRKAYDALPAGGAFVVIEALIDDARRENVFGLMMSLNMLIEFGDAFDYSGADFAGWCREAGFRSFAVIPLAGPSSAAVAYK